MKPVLCFEKEEKNHQIVAKWGKLTVMQLQRGLRGFFREKCSRFYWDTLSHATDDSSKDFENFLLFGLACLLANFVWRILVPIQ